MSAAQAVASAATKKTRPLSFLERLAPEWGRQAAWGIETDVRTPSWLLVSTMLSLIVQAVGAAMLFGDGFATIQAVRYFLASFGIAVGNLNGVPPLPWWSIQLVVTFLQIFAKHFRGMRLMWAPATIFNGITTGFFVGLWMAQITGTTLGLANFIETSVCGSIGAAIGLTLAVGAEQVAITGLLMLVSTVKAALKG